MQAGCPQKCKVPDWDNTAVYPNKRWLSGFTWLHALPFISCPALTDTNSDVALDALLHMLKTAVMLMYKTLCRSHSYSQGLNMLKSLARQYMTICSAALCLSCSQLQPGHSDICNSAHSYVSYKSILAQVHTHTQGSRARHTGPELQHGSEQKHPISCRIFYNQLLCNRPSLIKLFNRAGDMI